MEETASRDYGYLVLESTNKLELGEFVKSHLQVGWTAQGGVAVAYFDGEAHFYQAIIHPDGVKGDGYSWKGV